MQRSRISKACSYTRCIRTLGVLVRDKDHDHGKDRKRRHKEHRKERTSSRGDEERRIKPEGEAEEGEEQAEEGGGIDLTADMTPEEIQMMQAMGIPFSFDTTQGKMVSLATEGGGGGEP